MAAQAKGILDSIKPKDEHRRAEDEVAGRLPRTGASPAPHIVADGLPRRPSRRRQQASARRRPGRYAPGTWTSARTRAGGARQASRDGRSPLHWHLIGPSIPTRPTRSRGLRGCPSVHTLDLPRALVTRGRRGRGRPSGLIQIDLAQEATKSGLDHAELRPLLLRARDLPGVQVDGLMLLPPYSDDVEQVRPWFRRLRELRDTLRAEGTAAEQLRELSMGMSHDFEVAIEEGATIVRVGSAIFGSRG